MKNVLNKLSDKLNQNVDLALVLKGSGAAFISKILSSVLGVVSGVLIARFFGAEVVGAVSLMTAFITIITLVSVFGLNVATLRLVPKNKSAAFNLYFTILKICFVTSLVSGAIAYFASSFIGEELILFSDSTHFIRVAALMTFIFAMLQVSIAFLRSLGNIKAFSIATIIPSGLRLSLIVAALVLGLSNSAPIYLLLIVPSITAIFLFLYILKKYRVLSKCANISKFHIIRLSIPMMLTEGMYVVIANTDILMLGYFLGARQTGIYAASIGLILALTLIISAYQSFSTPKFAELIGRGREEELQLLAKESSFYLFVSLLVPCIILVLLGKFILGLLYGGEFQSGYTSIVILSIAYLFKGACGLTSGFLNMTGYEKQHFTIALLSGVINIVLNIFLIPEFGIEGAAIATGFSIVFWNVASLILIKVKFGFWLNVFSRRNISSAHKA